jgi:hypothetical protein
MLHSQPLCGPAHIKATLSDRNLANSESEFQQNQNSVSSDRVQIKVFDDMGVNGPRRIESLYLPKLGLGETM